MTNPTVVAADERVADVDLQHVVDVERWASLAAAVLVDEGQTGELTLTFVDRDEIAELNQQHMGQKGPTDVLSFPLDDGAPAAPDVPAADRLPVLLGDIVIAPAVAAEQYADHAGTYDDELALLVVHGVLHILGHDHVEPAETELMRAAELTHLSAHHWYGPAPAGFRQDQPAH